MRYSIGIPLHAAKAIVYYSAIYNPNNGKLRFTRIIWLDDPWRLVDSERWCVLRTIDDEVVCGYWAGEKR